LSVSSSFHQAFQAYSFLTYAFEAGSLLVQAYYIVGLVPFVDRLNQEVNRCLSVRAYYTHVAGLVLFVDLLNQEVNRCLPL